jgi:FtsZ-binding cell division protein ZapB
MIRLEQIRQLENGITKALERIQALRMENQKLREENQTLQGGIDSANRRMKELETMVEGFKADQKEIEEIVVRALGTLDELEEGISPAPAVEEPPKPKKGELDIF